MRADLRSRWLPLVLGASRVGARCRYRGLALGRVLVGAVIVVLVAAGSALGGGVNGTWAGRMIYSQEIGNIPTSAYPTVKLAVGPATISAAFHGRTQAAHDPESATSTCAMRFQFRGGLSWTGWRVYEEVGMPVDHGTRWTAGYVWVPVLHPGREVAWSSLRLRPAGNKLRAEFGEFGLRAPEFGAGYLRGYLSNKKQRTF